MLTYPNIDPVALSIGPVQIQWYGLMYLIGFLGVWWLGRIRARQSQSGSESGSETGSRWQVQEIDDLLFYGALGVVLGGRIGYMLFYNIGGWIENPLEVFRVWQGGMSFHGGMLGVFVACWLYGRKTGRTFFQVSDFIAPFVPIGLGAGRWGNFINGELWGLPTDLPWGMVFPFVDALPRHPSMLYEAILEGLVMFAILWWFSSRPRPIMAVSGLFLICYGTFRFMVELVRQPDAHLGYLAFDWVTMGQILSIPMLVFGVLFFWIAYKR